MFIFYSLKYNDKQSSLGISEIEFGDGSYTMTSTNNQISITYSILSTTADHIYTGIFYANTTSTVVDSRAHNSTSTGFYIWLIGANGIFIKYNWVAIIFS